MFLGKSRYSLKIEPLFHGGGPGSIGIQNLGNHNKSKNFFYIVGKRKLPGLCTPENIQLQFFVQKFQNPITDIFL